MTRGEFGELVMWLLVVVGIGGGWSLGLDPVAVGVVIAVGVFAAYKLTAVRR